MATFIPISIDLVAGRTVVRWIERAEVSPSLPFFAQTVRERLASGARERVTPLDMLLLAEGVEPTGLVMHQSRCGSTLLTQSLAHAGCVAVTSEAMPVNQLLTRGDIPELERVGLLRGLIRALGSQDGAGMPLPSLIKLTSWNVLFADIVRAAFPGTPWLFLYREPLEVLASHQRNPAAWLTDDRFFAGLTRAHRLPSLEGLAPEPRCAAALAAYGQAALRASPTAINLLNYHQLPAALCIDVPARFGVQLSPLQQRQVAEASRIYSKDASRQVVFDAARERRERPVSHNMREADRQYARPVYDVLEQCRAGGSVADANVDDWENPSVPVE